MEIIYYQRTRMLPADEKLYSATYCSTLDELLSTADIVSLHCLLNKKTEGMISFKEFATMKDGVFFINTSRGPLANEEALIQALESGKICRARLDVFHGEPKINPYFIRNDRVIMQPHMAGITGVAWNRAYREALGNARAFFETGKAISPINEEDVKMHAGTNSTTVRSSL